MQVAGSQNYQAYLQSQTWRLLREQRLAMDRYECVLCGRPASEVHHRRYPEFLGTETVMDLVSLCDDCHCKHHAVTPNGIRMPPRQPITRELMIIRDEMAEAETEGDEEREERLLQEYVNIRRAQVVG